MPAVSSSSNASQLASRASESASGDASQLTGSSDGTSQVTTDNGVVTTLHTIVDDHRQEIQPQPVPTPDTDRTQTAASAPDFEGFDGHYRPQKRGFVHNGRYYTGMAALRPVFIPPESFFVKQPQLWTQCTCERGCYRCVYDGATLCEPCKNECYDCEPGCCGNEEDVSDSCDEGAISDEGKPRTRGH